jgi:hypothetical protein
MLWYFFIGARYRPHSSLNMRQILRCAMACSTTARIFAQGGVESGLSGGEIDAGRSFDRAELDARDTDITVSIVALAVSAVSFGVSTFLALRQAAF